MGVAFMATVSVWAMAVMALAMATARGLLMLTLMPGTDMVAFTATDSQPMADMATAVMDTDYGVRRRGLLMLRPSLRLMPGWDMVASTATVLVWAMAVTAMAVLATDTARGLLMLRPSPGWDMVDSTATVLVWAMVATAMAVLATDTARGPLMLRPSLRLMPGWDMVASTATVSVWAMAATAMAV